VPKNINVLILKLRDLSPSQFDSIGISSVFPALIELETHYTTISKHKCA